MDTQHRQQTHLTPPPTNEQPPVESLHRVYVLSCAHCDAFVSDRGMRAVLLLRPSITLFSTDGMPYNCGPLYPDSNEDVNNSEQVERTCNCLTQSLGCYGCGNTIGYHIICPCSRCVDSVSKHRRAANGHRWVFHYGEVTYKERTYVLDEPGVIQPQFSPPRAPGLGRHSSQTSFLSVNDEQDHFQIQDLDVAKPEASYQYESETAQELFYDSELISISNQRRSRYIRTRHPASPRDSPSIQEGDPVYWHQLVSAGERAAPVLAKPTSKITSRPAR
ncbi:FAM72 protein-domain-containing protein [Melampsora americana]|nr:FAM72 protein-domain-containing protein [Melampsora americana]